MTSEQKQRGSCQSFQAFKILKVTEKYNFKDKTIFSYLGKSPVVWRITFRHSVRGKLRAQVERKNTLQGVEITTIHKNKHGQSQK